MEPKPDDEPPPERSSRPPAPKRRRGMITAGVAFLLIAGVSIKHLHDQQSPGPYPASAVRAHVTLTLASGHIRGRLTFTTPDNATSAGQYTVIVIENASHQPAHVTSAMPASGPLIRAGWDAHFDAVVSAFGGHGKGSALSFAPNTPAPIAFDSGVDAIRADQPASQVTVLLAFFSPDGRRYWVQKVPA